MSKSTFGLHGPGIEEQEETLGVSQMELDQTNMKRFSMSQPELDTSDIFDIPSPPPVATNQSESYFTFLNQSESSIAIKTQTEANGPRTNASHPVDVHQEPKRAPIATIPELQLDDPISSEMKHVPVCDNSSKIDPRSSASTTHTTTTSAADDETVAVVPVRQPGVELETSDLKAAPVDSARSGESDNVIFQQSDTKTDTSLTESTGVSVSNYQPPNDKPYTGSVDAQIDAVITESSPVPHTDNSALNTSAVGSINNILCDNDILRQSDTKPHTSLSTGVTISKHQPDAPNTAGCTTPNDRPSVKSVDSKLNKTMAESSPFPPTENSAPNAVSASASEALISRTERSLPETTNSVTAVSGERSSRPVDQDKVYGELYDSLFPQNFTSEVISSLLNPPAQVYSEIRHLDAKSKPVMIKTRNECQTETNVMYSHLSASPTFDSAAHSMDDAVAGYTNSEVISAGESSRSTSYQTSAVSGLDGDLDIHHRYPPSSSLLSGSEPADNNTIPYSELTHDPSEVKSASIRDTVKSVPVIQSSAPPVSDYVTPQGTDSQITATIRRVILVKESVADRASADSGSLVPVPDKMSAAEDLERKLEIAVPPARMEGLDGPLSPTYLSVGSDDGSAMEIYYSAEEDNADSGEEEMYKVDKLEDLHLADRVKEAIRLPEEFTQQGEVTGMSERDGGEMRVVKVLSEGGKIDTEEKKDVGSWTEIQQQLRGQISSQAQVQEPGLSEFLEGNDAKSQAKEEATKVFLQVKEEGQEERKEELLATPVQQVNKLMVCEFAPPSGEPRGQGEGSEGNWTKELETKDHRAGEKLYPSQEIQYLAHKDISPAHTHTASGNTGEVDTITPKAGGEGCKASTITSTSATTSPAQDSCGGVKAVTGTLTCGAELRSDATGTEHNKAPVENQSSEWVDTITQHTDRTWTIQEQVAVELSVPEKGACHPDTDATDSLSERYEHPAEPQLDLNQGSPTAPQVFASENQPPEADQEVADNMNSGYSSLSTKLTIKNISASQEDESKRFRKLSLISEGGATEAGQDAAESSTTSTTVTEVNGADLRSEYRWKNRFEWVSQNKPYRPEDSSYADSLSNTESDTYSRPSSLSSSALPEATAYKYDSHAYSSETSTPPEEHITPGNRLNDRASVYLSGEGEPAGERRYEWRRSLVEQEEPAAAAGERERLREAEPERIKSRWDSPQLHVSGLSSTQQSSYDATDSFRGHDDYDSSLFTGVFQATRVELVSEPAAPPSTPPASPDTDSPSQFEMDSLVDTLKSMGPTLKPRHTLMRGPAPTLISSLPPIVEDAPSPVTADVPDSGTSALNGFHSQPTLPTLPADLGLKRSTVRDTRSPLELMKQSQQNVFNHLQDQQQIGTRSLTLPLRASATNSIVMRKSSDSTTDDLLSPVHNGNGILQSPNTGSRLDNSVIFGGYRSSSVDQMHEGKQAHRQLFRAASLPEIGPKEPDVGSGTDLASSRFERFSFLLNSSSSASGSLSGADDSNTRMSRPPQLGITSPPSSNSPTRLLSPTSSIDLHRPFAPTDSPLSMFGQTQGLGMGMGVGNGGLGTPILQRSFSSDGIMGVQQTPLFISEQGGPQFQSQEPERNLTMKYRAFPDAYLTKEKEHGKLNPRPGKMYIFDRPGMCGQRTEVRGDVIDATSWELEETISIRVVRGGWVLYEQPNFKGEKIALDEGDIELTCPFSPPEEQPQNGQREGEVKGAEQNGETAEGQTEAKPARRFIIGSIRRAVRDYSVPEISLFPEENAEGKKVIFRDTSEDARIFGFPIKATSIIINAGLWLVYAHPFFQGVPRVLEVGGYSNPAAWGVESPYVGSVHPLKVGEPRVENTSEPKMVVFEKPYFSGKSRTINCNTKDFMTRMDLTQKAFMHNIGSLKVLGGIWVGYEKENFRGHQYLLEEGEYHDWRVWGGCDAEMRSVRVIRADLTDPMMVMFELPEEEEEQGTQEEENTFEVTEAIPDVELFGYKTSTRSIHVLNGAWIAYSHVDFSGSQYILEKGFYNNCADWGSQDNRICSVQPILLAQSDGSKTRNEVILYSEPDFQGECHYIDRNQDAVSEKLLTKSCRVSGGSWVIYEHKQYTGNLYVLSEGDYPNLTSMGCPPGFAIRSIKAVPMTFTVPSISLFGLECLEGREITTDTEIINMVEEGFNNHILSLRVNRGCWVICEHGNFRGRQFLLEPIEITNWLKFSSLQTVGSMFPIRQKRRFFRIKNKERGHFMSVQGGVEEMKSGRVVVSPEAEPMSDIWFYQDGFIKNKLSQTMSLQVMGNVEPGAKAVLWSETRQPLQTWTTQMRGLITSLTFPGMVLDVKGGKTYDKDHVVILPENDERPSQQWEIELL
ncbi:uncharacterized protein LOC119016931 isoform X4 [Acanthopagrus latus]|nr:uncharacterized protein LOC119016931 isoform X4 [Acanthopagrus latus]